MGVLPSYLIVLMFYFSNKKADRPEHEDERKTKTEEVITAVEKSDERRVNKELAMVSTLRVPTKALLGPGRQP